MTDFEDLIWLFSSNTHSRGTVRMNIAEGAMLYKYAKKKKDSDILEVGRKFGGSSILIACGLDRGHLYSIDIVTHDKTLKNLKPYEDKITLITSDSRKVKWNKPLGMVFIDGDHNPKVVAQDIKNFTPHVEPGGYAVFHDTTKVSISKLMKGMIKKGWKKEATADTLMVLKKS